MTERNLRPLEAGIERDLRDGDYGSYLRLDRLLSRRSPLSGHHDELLFIVQHQTTELWIKLVIHELRSAMTLIAADDLAPALKRLARVKHVQKQMTDQWSVLATLTPTEYVQFRDRLGKASGFQSAQYRMLEFLLGNKNAGVLAVFGHEPASPGGAARRARGAEPLRRVPAFPAPPRLPGSGAAGRARLDPPAQADPRPGRVFAPVYEDAGAPVGRL